MANSNLHVMQFLGLSLEDNGQTTLSIVAFQNTVNVGGSVE